MVEGLRSKTNGELVYAAAGRAISVDASLVLAVSESSEVCMDRVLCGVSVSALRA